MATILLALEKVLLKKKIYKIQLETNDEIFKIYPADEIINECARNWQLNLTNRDEQQRILTEYHNDRIRGGHNGRNRLYAKLRSQFYWKRMARDVENFVRKCEKCKLNKPRPGTRVPMAITATPQKAFEYLIIDTIGPMNKTIYGNVCAITLICDLTKYLITLPIPNKEAKTIAKAIFENLILIYGTPKTIRTDLGKEYKNEIIKELCKLLNVEHHFSTPYHHESLGSIERNHRLFNEYIRAYSNEDTWDINLRYFTYCYNTSFSASLNHTYTPFELVFGKRANDIQSLNDPIEPIYNMDDYEKDVTNSKRKNKQIYWQN